MNSDDRQMYHEEKPIRAKSGMGVLILAILLILASIAGIVWGIIIADGGRIALGVTLIVICCILFIASFFLLAGIKLIRPNEAAVFTLFGEYYGVLKKEGFYFVNPFASAVSSATTKQQNQLVTAVVKGASGGDGEALTEAVTGKKISLKAMTLNNNQQKINDLLGNPIIIGVVVIWHVSNPTKAVFNVDNYQEFLSIQCDSALRNIVRLYPYDSFGNESEQTLRGSSVEIAEKLRVELQKKVEIAGIEVTEARITHLSYAPEIASAMLQRQQASAIVDARQMIVEGAVGMVQMALDKLSEDDIVNLDEERKAAMVSNLLVVLCGNRDAQPIVNSGSLY